MSIYENQVIQKITDRAVLGKKKYGCTVERDDLSTLEWLSHAQQEAMDLAIYLERLITKELK